MSGNPADSRVVKRFRVSDVSRTEGLSPEEVDRLLKACDGRLLGLRDRALLMTLYYQGLGRSEVSKLNYRDLTTKPGLLTIREAKNNDYAEIRMSPEALQCIEEYPAILNQILNYSSGSLP